MTRQEEIDARRKVASQLRREGWKNTGPGLWRRDGLTFDLDAVVMVDGRLRSAWAVKWEEMQNGS